jgi:hypothetical protein
MTPNTNYASSSAAVGRFRHRAIAAGSCIAVRTLQYNEDLPGVILMSEKGSRNDVVVDNETKVLISIISGNYLVLTYSLPCYITSCFHS